MSLPIQLLITLGSAAASHLIHNTQQQSKGIVAGTESHYVQTCHPQEPSHLQQKPDRTPSRNTPYPTNPPTQYPSQYYYKIPSAITHHGFNGLIHLSSITGRSHYTHQYPANLITEYENAFATLRHTLSLASSHINLVLKLNISFTNLNDINLFKIFLETSVYSPYHEYYSLYGRDSAKYRSNDTNIPISRVKPPAITYFEVPCLSDREARIQIDAIACNTSFTDLSFAPPPEVSALPLHNSLLDSLAGHGSSIPQTTKITPPRPILTPIMPVHHSSYDHKLSLYDDTVNSSALTIHRPSGVGFTSHILGVNYDPRTVLRFSSSHASHPHSSPYSSDQSAFESIQQTKIIDFLQEQFNNQYDLSRGFPVNANTPSISTTSGKFLQEKLFSDVSAPQTDFTATLEPNYQNNIAHSVAYKHRGVQLSAKIRLAQVRHKLQQIHRIEKENYLHDGNTVQTKNIDNSFQFDKKVDQPLAQYHDRTRREKQRQLATLLQHQQVTFQEKLARRLLHPVLLSKQKLELAQAIQVYRSAMEKLSPVLKKEEEYDNIDEINSKLHDSFANNDIQQYISIQFHRDNQNNEDNEEIPYIVLYPFTFSQSASPEPTSAVPTNDELVDAIMCKRELILAEKKRIIAEYHLEYGDPHSCPSREENEVAADARRAFLQRSFAQIAKRLKTTENSGAHPDSLIDVKSVLTHSIRALSEISTSSIGNLYSAIHGSIATIMEELNTEMMKYTFQRTAPFSAIPIQPAGYVTIHMYADELWDCGVSLLDVIDDQIFDPLRNSLSYKDYCRLLCCSHSFILHQILSIFTTTITNMIEISQVGSQPPSAATLSNKLDLFDDSDHTTIFGGIVLPELVDPHLHLPIDETKTPFLTTFQNHLISLGRFIKDTMIIDGSTFILNHTVKWLTPSGVSHVVEFLDESALVLNKLYHDFSAELGFYYDSLTLQNDIGLYDGLVSLALGAEQSTPEYRKYLQLLEKKQLSRSNAIESSKSSDSQLSVTTHHLQKLRSSRRAARDVRRHNEILNKVRQSAWASGTVVENDISDTTGILSPETVQVSSTAGVTSDNNENSTSNLFSPKANPSISDTEELLPIDHPEKEKIDGKCVKIYLNKCKEMYYLHLIKFLVWYKTLRSSSSKDLVADMDRKFTNLMEKRTAWLKKHPGKYNYYLKRAYQRLYRSMRDAISWGTDWAAAYARAANQMAKYTFLKQKYFKELEAYNLQLLYYKQRDFLHNFEDHMASHHERMGRLLFWRKEFARRRAFRQEKGEYFRAQRKVQRSEYYSHLHAQKRKLSLEKAKKERELEEKKRKIQHEYDILRQKQRIVREREDNLLAEALVPHRRKVYALQRENFLVWKSNRQLFYSKLASFREKLSKSFGFAVYNKMRHKRWVRKLKELNPTGSVLLGDNHHTLSLSEDPIFSNAVAIDELYPGYSLTFTGLTDPNSYEKEAAQFEQDYAAYRFEAQRRFVSAQTLTNEDRTEIVTLLDRQFELIAQQRRVENDKRLDAPAGATTIKLTKSVKLFAKKHLSEDINDNNTDTETIYSELATQLKILKEHYLQRLFTLQQQHQLYKMQYVNDAKLLHYKRIRIMQQQKAKVETYQDQFNVVLNTIDNVLFHQAQQDNMIHNNAQQYPRTYTSIQEDQTPQNNEPTDLSSSELHTIVNTAFISMSDDLTSINQSNMRQLDQLMEQVTNTISSTFNDRLISVDDELAENTLILAEADEDDPDTAFPYDYELNEDEYDDLVVIKQQISTLNDEIDIVEEELDILQDEYAEYTKNSTLTSNKSDTIELEYQQPVILQHLDDTLITPQLSIYTPPATQRQFEIYTEIGQAFYNLHIILLHDNINPQTSIAKLTIYLKNMKHLNFVKQYLNRLYPAHNTPSLVIIAVTDLPLNANIALDCVITHHVKNNTNNLINAVFDRQIPSSIMQTTELPRYANNALTVCKKYLSYWFNLFLSSTLHLSRRMIGFGTYLAAPQRESPIDPEVSDDSDVETYLSNVSPELMADSELLAAHREYVTHRTMQRNFRRAERRRMRKARLEKQQHTDLDPNYYDSEGYKLEEPGSLYLLLRSWDQILGSCTSDHDKHLTNLYSTLKYTSRDNYETFRNELFRLYGVDFRNIPLPPDNPQIKKNYEHVTLPAGPELFTFPLNHVPENRSQLNPTLNVSEDSLSIRSVSMMNDNLSNYYIYSDKLVISPSSDKQSIATASRVALPQPKNGEKYADLVTLLHNSIFRANKHIIYRSQGNPIHQSAVKRIVPCTLSEKTLAKIAKQSEYKKIENRKLAFKRCLAYRLMLPRTEEQRLALARRYRELGFHNAASYEKYIQMRLYAHWHDRQRPWEEYLSELSVFDLCKRFINSVLLKQMNNPIDALVDTQTAKKLYYTVHNATPSIVSSRAGIFQRLFGRYTLEELVGFEMENISLRSADKQLASSVNQTLLHSPVITNQMLEYTTQYFSQHKSLPELLSMYKTVERNYLEHYNPMVDWLETIHVDNELRYCKEDAQLALYDKYNVIDNNNINIDEVFVSQQYDKNDITLLRDSILSEKDLIYERIRARQYRRDMERYETNQRLKSLEKIREQLQQQEYEAGRHVGSFIQRAPIKPKIDHHITDIMSNTSTAVVDKQWANLVETLYYDFYKSVETQNRTHVTIMKVLNPDLDIDNPTQNHQIEDNMQQPTPGAFQYNFDENNLLNIFKHRNDLSVKQHLSLLEDRYSQIDKDLYHLSTYNKAKELLEKEGLGLKKANGDENQHDSIANNDYKDLADEHYIQRRKAYLQLNYYFNTMLSVIKTLPYHNVFELFEIFNIIDLGALGFDILRVKDRLLATLLSTVSTLFTTPESILSALSSTPSPLVENNNIGDNEMKKTMNIAENASLTITSSVEKSLLTHLNELIIFILVLFVNQQQTATKTIITWRGNAHREENSTLVNYNVFKGHDIECIQQIITLLTDCIKVLILNTATNIDGNNSVHKLITTLRAMVQQFQTALLEIIHYQQQHSKIEQIFEYVINLPNMAHLASYTHSLSKDSDNMLIIKPTIFYDQSVIQDISILSKQQQLEYVCSELGFKLQSFKAEALMFTIKELIKAPQLAFPSKMPSSAPNIPLFVSSSDTINTLLIRITRNVLNILNNSTQYQELYGVLKRQQFRLKRVLLKEMYRDQPQTLKVKLQQLYTMEENHDEYYRNILPQIIQNENSGDNEIDCNEKDSAFILGNEKTVPIRSVIPENPPNTHHEDIFFQAGVDHKYDLVMNSKLPQKLIRKNLIPSTQLLTNEPLVSVGDAQLNLTYELKQEKVNDNISIDAEIRALQESQRGSKKNKAEKQLTMEDLDITTLYTTTKKVIVGGNRRNTHVHNDTGDDDGIDSDEEEYNDYCQYQLLSMQKMIKMHPLFGYKSQYIYNKNKYHLNEYTDNNLADKYHPNHKVSKLSYLEQLYQSLTSVFTSSLFHLTPALQFVINNSFFQLQDGNHNKNENCTDKRNIAEKTVIFYRSLQQHYEDYLTTVITTYDRECRKAFALCDELRDPEHNIVDKIHNNIVISEFNLKCVNCRQYGDIDNTIYPCDDDNTKTDLHNRNYCEIGYSDCYLCRQLQMLYTTTNQWETSNNNSNLFMLTSNNSVDNQYDAVAPTFIGPRYGGDFDKNQLVARILARNTQRKSTFLSNGYSTSYANAAKFKILTFTEFCSALYTEYVNLRALENASYHYSLSPRDLSANMSAITTPITKALSCQIGPSPSNNITTSHQYLLFNLNTGNTLDQRTFLQRCADYFGSLFSAIQHTFLTAVTTPIYYAFPFLTTSPSSIYDIVLYHNTQIQNRIGQYSSISSATQTIYNHYPTKLFYLQLLKVYLTQINSKSYQVLFNYQNHNNIDHYPTLIRSLIHDCVNYPFEKLSLSLNSNYRSLMRTTFNYFNQFWFHQVDLGDHGYPYSGLNDNNKRVGETDKNKQTANINSYSKYNINVNQPTRRPKLTPLYINSLITSPPHHATYSGPTESRPSHYGMPRPRTYYTPARYHAELEKHNASVLREQRFLGGPTASQYFHNDPYLSGIHTIPLHKRTNIDFSARSKNGLMKTYLNPDDHTHALLTAQTELHYDQIEFLLPPIPRYFINSNFEMVSIQDAYCNANVLQRIASQQQEQKQEQKQQSHGVNEHNVENSSSIDFVNHSSPKPDFGGVLIHDDPILEEKRQQRLYQQRYQDQQRSIQEIQSDMLRQYANDLTFSLLSPAPASHPSTTPQLSTLPNLDGNLLAIINSERIPPTTSFSLPKPTINSLLSAPFTCVIIDDKVEYLESGKEFFYKKTPFHLDDKEQVHSDNDSYINTLYKQQFLRKLFLGNNSTQVSIPQTIFSSTFYTDTLLDSIIQIQRYIQQCYGFEYVHVTHINIYTTQFGHISPIQLTKTLSWHFCQLSIPLPTITTFCTTQIPHNFYYQFDMTIVTK